MFVLVELLDMSNQGLLDKWETLNCLATAIFLYWLLTQRKTRDKLERTRASGLRRPVSEMGEYGGVLLQKFKSCHCLENEPKKMNCRRHWRLWELARPHQVSELELIAVEETKISPSKQLPLLQVAGTKEPTPRESEETVATNASVAG